MTALRFYYLMLPEMMLPKRPKITLGSIHIESICIICENYVPYSPLKTYLDG